MTRILKRLQHYARRLVTPPLPVALSLGYSVVMHGVVLLLVSFLASLLSPPPMPFPPPQFQFTFLPGEYERSVLPEPRLAEAPHTVNTATHQPEFMQADNKAPLPADESAATSPVTASPAVNSATLLLADANTRAPHAAPDTRPAFLAKSPQALLRHATGIRGYGGRSIFAAPPSSEPSPNLAAATLPLANKEARTLEKKVTELIRKLMPRSSIDSTLLWQHDGESYVMRVQHRPASSATALDEFVVGISCDGEGYDLATEVRLQRVAFSHFAQFVDYWDPKVALHDDRLEGRFHSNTAISISSSKGVKPHLNGKVTTAAFKVKNLDPYAHFFHDEIFSGGLETGVREIRLPKELRGHMGEEAQADSLCLLFAEDTWIVFEQEGSLTWSNQSVAVPQRRRLPRVEPFRLIGRSAVLHVRGTVNGKVQVYSDKKIVIDDDLLYASDPQFQLSSDDYLGLVSRRDIEIAAPEITGPGDLRIYAAIFAKGRFHVRDIYGCDPATLYVYGSLSTGSISATEPRYATDVRFDRRLESRRPPGFPMTEQYEIVEWDRRWQVKRPQDQLAGEIAPAR